MLSLFLVWNHVLQILIGNSLCESQHDDAIHSSTNLDKEYCSKWHSCQKPKYEESTALLCQSEDYSKLKKKKKWMIPMVITRKWQFGSLVQIRKEFRNCGRNLGHEWQRLKEDNQINNQRHVSIWVSNHAASAERESIFDIRNGERVNDFEKPKTARGRERAKMVWTNTGIVPNQPRFAFS